MPDFLYETDNYYVDTTTFIDPVLGEEVQGYGVFNKATKIREAEARRLLTAKTHANRFEEDEAEFAKVVSDKTLMDMEAFDA